MKNVFLKDRFGESERWLRYHKEVASFLKGYCVLPDLEKEKNVKVIYASPNSAYVKYIVPMLNGQSETPILTFLLESEEMTQDIAPFMRANTITSRDSNGNLVLNKIKHPIIKSLRYTCNLFTNTKTQADLLLTRMELECNSFLPFNIKVNNKNSQLYMKDVKNDSQINISVGEKRVETSSFTIEIPRAYISQTEVVSNADEIKEIKAYIGLEGYTEEI